MSTTQDTERRGIPQSTRDQLVKEGYVFEPPKHVRPAKGPCPYVDLRNPRTGMEVSRRFAHEGRFFEVQYVDGCFYPFVFEILPRVTIANMVGVTAAKFKL